MKARAPYKLEAFVGEYVSLYGSMPGTGLLTGDFAFKGWAADGTVAWNFTTGPGVTITDSAARTYSAAVDTTALAAGVYRFEVIQTSAPYTVWLWGFLTLTGAPPEEG